MQDVYSKMKTNQLIRPWKGDKRFTQMSARAAALKKAGDSGEAILATLEAEFGPSQKPLNALRDHPQPFFVCGEVGRDGDIEPAAQAQLELALRLPPSVRGALMPDAHPGYALPIGGVLAMHNAVAPAMVGVDIGCRMHLSVFADSPEVFQKHRPQLFGDLRAVTAFGIGARRVSLSSHALLDSDDWDLTAQTRSLKARAAAQLGTSGAGNHFAELVIGETSDADSGLPLRFCGLLTHSGSRGVGYALAEHYKRLAATETAARAKVPKFYEWLDLDGDSGREYWQAMTLAGDFACACHEVIHQEFAHRAGLTPVQTIQNHHNFAWRVGDLVIHRKGATPAERGTRGVIPGSMGTASYIVEGLGHPDALWSASHGAGRRGSRTQARDRIGLADVRRALKAKDILVDGLSVEEAPDAYKDIERVLRLQTDAGLIKPLARMHPLAVIMAGESGEN
jgi:tRNA-splicing ligase RtcB